MLSVRAGIFGDCYTILIKGSKFRAGAINELSEQLACLVSLKCHNGDQRRSGKRVRQSNKNPKP